MSRIVDEKNAKRPGTSGSGKTTRYRPQESKGSLRWADVNPLILVDALDALQSAGDALLCGATRDGGVLVLTICSGDERTKFYCSSASELDKSLLDITTAAKGLSGTRR